MHITNRVLQPHGLTGKVFQDVCMTPSWLNPSTSTSTATPMWSAWVSTLVARSTFTALTAYSRSPVMNWRLAQSVPCLHLASAGIGSSPPQPHVGSREWMEYLGGWRNSLNSIEMSCGENHHCSKLVIFNCRKPTVFVMVPFNL